MLINIIFFFTGLDVKLPTGQKTNIKACIILSPNDLPAKAVLMCMKQFNAIYGCHVCEQTSEARTNAPMARQWPFKENVPLRSRKTILENAKEALETGNPVCL